MDSLLNLVAALISFAAAGLTLFTVEWATRAGRLRRRVEFLRGEVATRQPSDPRMSTLRRLLDETLARLIAIEMIPAPYTLWAIASAFAALAISVWLGHEIAIMVLSQKYDLVSVLLGITAVLGASSEGLESLLGLQRERERVRTEVLAGRPFVPIFTLTRTLTRPWQLLPQHNQPGWSLFRLLAVLVGGATIGVMIVATSNRDRLPPDHWLITATLFSVMGVGVLGAFLSIIEGWRKRDDPITREQLEAVHLLEQHDLERAWGVTVPEAASESDHVPDSDKRPVPKRRPVRVRDLAYLWIVDRGITLLANKRQRV